MNKADLMAVEQAQIMARLKQVNHDMTWHDCEMVQVIGTAWEHDCIATYRADTGGWPIKDGKVCAETLCPSCAAQVALVIDRRALKKNLGKVRGAITRHGKALMDRYV